MNVAAVSSIDDPSHPLRVLFLGPPNSFSHAAAKHVFPRAHLEAVADFPTIFELLEHDGHSEPKQLIQNGLDVRSNANGERPKPYDYAIVPVCNSTNGPVIPVVQLLRRCGDGQGSLLHELEQNHGISGLDKIFPLDLPTDPPLQPITNTTTTSQTSSQSPPERRYPSIHPAEPYTHALSVHHYLYTHRSSAIFRVSAPPDDPEFGHIPSLHTHPQVWTQCTGFLAAHFTKATSRVSHNSTSEAAEFVAGWKPAGGEGGQGGVKEKGEAFWPIAICSRMAGEASGLGCVAERIEDDGEGNTTTFVVLGRSN
jgi:prephenate dehydratase